jgi:hypothetical protein
MPGRFPELDVYNIRDPGANQGVVNHSDGLAGLNFRGRQSLTACSGVN